MIALSSAHNIQLKAHVRECFHEQLHADDKMTVTFQVGDREFGGSGNLDVDFWVCTAPYTHLVLRHESHLAISIPLLRAYIQQTSPLLPLYLADMVTHRSKTLPVPTKSTSVVLPRVTTPLPHTWTAATPTASATNTGPPTPRRSASTSTVLSTSRRARLLKIRSRRRFALCLSCCHKSRMSRDTLSFASALTGTLPRAPTPESSGGASSSLGLLLALVSSRSGGSSASSRLVHHADIPSTKQPPC